MADQAKLVAMIQGKTLNFSEGYKNAVLATIEYAWAEMGERHDWWFLRAPVPYTLPLEANINVYLVGRDDVGRLIKISDSGGKKSIRFVSDDYLDDSLAPISEGTNIDTPQYFTLYGLGANERKQILIHPTPNASDTRHLHYCQKPTLGNLTKLPDSHAITLFHKVMSVLAPPEERRNPDGMLWWKALTKDEDFLYESDLRKMIAQAKPVRPDIPDNRIDPYLENRLNEIQDL